RLAGRVGEVRRDAVVVLVDPQAAVAGHYAVRAQALAHRRQQRHLQVAAVDRVLGPVVAGRLAGRLAVDELAVAVEEDRLAGVHAQRIQRRQQAQFVEFAGGVRQQVDAHAQRPDLGHGFIDAAADAGLVQAQRQHQAAHAGADNDDFGVALHGYTTFTRSVSSPSTPPSMRSPATTGPTPSGVPV